MFLNNKKLYLVFIVAAGISTSFYLFFNSYKRGVIDLTPAGGNTVREATDIKRDDNSKEASSLKRYFSKKYLYSLTIPSSASIFEREDFNYLPFTGERREITIGENFDEYGVFMKGKEIIGYQYTLRILENKNHLLLKQYADSLTQIAPEEIGTMPKLAYKTELISVSGYDAYIAEYGQGGRAVLLKKDDFIYSFSAGFSPPREDSFYFDSNFRKHEDIFKQILLNFRFLDRASGDIIKPPKEGYLLYPELPEL